MRVVLSLHDQHACISRCIRVFASLLFVLLGGYRQAPLQILKFALTICQTRPNALTESPTHLLEDACTGREGGRREHGSLNGSTYRTVDDISAISKRARSR